MASRRIVKKGFLTGYSLEDRYLVLPDVAHGRAGIKCARDPESNDVLVKLWPRTEGSSDADLSDIWRSEIRQLQRLAAVPGADDLFVHMIASGEDADAFYLILDPGQGSPLEVFLQATRSRSCSLRRGLAAPGGSSGPTRGASRRYSNFCIPRAQSIATSTHGAL